MLVLHKIPYRSQILNTKPEAKGNLNFHLGFDCREKERNMFPKRDEKVSLSSDFCANEEMPSNLCKKGSSTQLDRLQV